MKFKSRRGQPQRKKENKEQPSSLTKSIPKEKKPGKYDIIPGNNLKARRVKGAGKNSARKGLISQLTGQP